MNHVALMQSIQGRCLIINTGNSNSEEAPKKPNRFAVYRNIDLVDVYHISNCDFFLEPPPQERLHIRNYTYGEFYHPFLMIGMPSVGGSVKLEIDTRYPGWYIMWAGVKMDSWAVGPSERAWDAVCWTPKVSGDNIKKAGNRLCRALIMKMDGAEEGQLTTKNFLNEEWESEWNAHEHIMEIMRNVRTP